jgi:type IV secretory pathway TrbD component
MSLRSIIIVVGVPCEVVGLTLLASAKVLKVVAIPIVAMVRISADCRADPLPTSAILGNSSSKNL